jgi:hypothetical protein
MSALGERATADTWMPDLEVIAGIPLYNPVARMQAERKRVLTLPAEWRGKTVGFVGNAKANFAISLPDDHHLLISGGSASRACPRSPGEPEGNSSALAPAISACGPIAMIRPIP